MNTITITILLLMVLAVYCQDIDENGYDNGKKYERRKDRRQDLGVEDRKKDRKDRDHCGSSCCERGSPGLNGNPGAPGIPGATGQPGRDGLQGLQGVPGIQGLQGLRGNPGPSGAEGPRGLTTQGPPGKSGQPGPVGVTGKPGIPGPVGPQGQPFLMEIPAFDSGYETFMTTAFTAIRTRNLAGHPGYPKVISFDTIVTNVGNDFNSTHFTCTRNGVYFFTFHITHNRDPSVELLMNNQRVVSIHGDSANHHQQSFSNSVVLDLRRGDLVWLRLVTDHSISGDSLNLTTFSGFLISAT